MKEETIGAINDGKDKSGNSKKGHYSDACENILRGINGDEIDIKLKESKLSVLKANTEIDKNYTDYGRIVCF